MTLVTASDFGDCRSFAVADPGGGGLGGLTPLQRLGVFCACQYMKIPTDLDPKPPLRRILAQNPPFKEFLDPPLIWAFRRARLGSAAW